MLGLLFSKFSYFFGHLVLSLHLLFLNFKKISLNTLMIYKTRKSGRKRDLFWCSFLKQSVKNHRTKTKHRYQYCVRKHKEVFEQKLFKLFNATWKPYWINKIWSFKSLAILKCQSRVSLHAVQYLWQPGFVLIILRMTCLDTLFLCSVLSCS